MSLTDRHLGHMEGVLPVAKLYCSTCQRVVDLAVGKYKDECKGDRCGVCGGYGVVWMNSYREISTGGCLHIVDEVAASRFGCQNWGG